MISLTVSASPQVTTTRVMVCASGSLSALRAVLRQRAHDVAFGQDADHALLGAEHDHRADAMLGEDCDRFFERGSGSRS